MPTTVFKDSQGCLWASTRYGLRRYDGYTSTLFTKEKNGLGSNNGIRNVMEDTSGNLWLIYSNRSPYNSKIKQESGFDILPADDYTLRVKGRHKGKGWSEQELLLPIQVLKPFYWQWWFILLLISITIAFFFYIIKSREAKYQTHQKNLKQEIIKRTQQIEYDKQIIAKQAEELKKLDKSKNSYS